MTGFSFLLLLLALLGAVVYYVVHHARRIGNTLQHLRDLWKQLSPHTIRRTERLHVFLAAAEARVVDSQAEMAGMLKAWEAECRALSEKSSPDLNDWTEAENRLQESLGRWMQEPTLQAVLAKETSDDLRALKAAVAQVEVSVQQLKNQYNDEVRILNALANIFPASLIARALQVDHMQPFTQGTWTQQEETMPVVSFDS
ncbi:MAG: LemA family protein [Candidatus Melainabacteria bacterium]